MLFYFQKDITCLQKKKKDINIDFGIISNWKVNKTKLCSGPAPPVHIGM